MNTKFVSVKNHITLIISQKRKKAGMNWGDLVLYWRL